MWEKHAKSVKKRLDNPAVMPYNNYCCAGVAHLVERDLAKVEVASSSLVARSKKKHHPSGWCFFLVKSGRGSKGHERSEKNMPVACFGARVRVAARQGRQRCAVLTVMPTGWHDGEQKRVAAVKIGRRPP